MNMEDPWMRAADQVLENLADWWAEATLAEPRAIMRFVNADMPAPPPGQDSPVEKFAIRREDLLNALRPIRNRVKRLKARLRHVYKLRYVEGLPYAEVAAALDPPAGLRSVERYVGQIRACVAATLRRQSPERKATIRGLLTCHGRREKRP